MLVKLVCDEPESPALLSFIAGADLVTSDLVLAEVPRAIRRAAVVDVSPLDGLLTYDDRQAAAARLAGLRTFAPGA